MTMKSSSRFYRINKLDRDYSHWQILSLVYPVKYHVTAFISSILERVQRWRVSLNYGVSGRKVAVKYLNPIDGP